MALREFSIKSQCVADDATLFNNIESALGRGLPVLGQAPPHNDVAVLVGSGPSVAACADEIRIRQNRGERIVALKDAHDWLIAQGIIPDYAVAIDPQESRARVFTPCGGVFYLIASQVHPALLDHLNGSTVFLWHAYIREGQTMPPPGTPMIAGGTTTGLRAITLFYSMGFRTVHLYGFDSCLKDGVLRVNGSKPRPGDDKINEIIVAGRTFYANPSMTAQASEFQNLYGTMPDLTIHAHGDGLIPAIVKARAERPLRTVSFLHHYGPNSASFRYRAQMPADWLGATLNDLSADVLVVSKPDAITIPEMKQALGKGQSVIVDFCDDHFDHPHYRDMLRLADAVTCPTDVMRDRIIGLGRVADVIPDPYEFPEASSHCHGNNLLWFGHQSNLPAANLDRFNGYPLRIVSNAPGCIPWSRETMLEEFAKAHIVILPASAAYKSANRAVEAIRQGCFVAAEPHPALLKIPGIWLGDIKEGIEWATQHQQEANSRIRTSQTYVSQAFGPRTVAYAWSRVIQACPSTWGQELAPGPIGSMLTSMESMSVAT